ncbi:hypothetical protein LB467_02005 [Salegentibacter sp. JZCK2]|uniref:hypothetical protein n=1 Tax=Salegentibacter tibetensis TaxID=2873600 RepID=UPI001CCFF560|nr:hypothetical protein [Salegentibacter tibetensis]MBZ9728447.1 hypothetical protein [Salegentibacter tibetensis]
MTDKIQKILNKKWEPLFGNYKNIEDGNYPGNYLLAFTDKNLNGQTVEPRDIFYIGMSNARKGINNLGASPRGMNEELFYNFEASLGELNPNEGLKNRGKQFLNEIEKNGSHSAGMHI